ncbi:MAG: tyrosine-type recombinase/integrase [Chloracidobacterium sp.]|nr:tyrosine-type recombinase/integrase [Chloracidobacterium sp.]
MWTENQKQKLELLRGRFIEYLMAVNYSPATLVNYSRDAGIFLDWLTENTALNSIADVTAAHLSQYQITGTLRIEHGKGNETRLVPLTQSSQTALKLYLEQARTAFASQPGQIRLFVSSRSGGPLDVDDIRRIVRKWTKNANIKKNVTPHTMRHSCATHLLKGRADIRQIQKLLGHRRLSSTEIYTHVELGDLAEVISRCHPREKSGR